jgi:hypothetical protein
VENGGPVDNGILMDEEDVSSKLVAVASVEVDEPDELPL